MSQLHLKIITPEKEIYDSIVDEVIVPSFDGELGILPHHVNLMAQLIPGELRIKNGNKTDIFATGGGFVQVTKLGVTVLTDMAIDHKDIDERLAGEAKKRAEQALMEREHLSAEEYAATFASLERSLAQLKVKRHRRSN